MTKDVQDLYTESYKTSLRKINEDIKNGEIRHAHVHWKTLYN